MHCTHGAQKHREYHSTLEATVPHYVVPVLLSSYCTHGAVKYWEYHSTWEATVQHYVVPVLLSTYCTQNFHLRETSKIATRFFHVNLA